jgi:Calpain family cysteine protease
MYNPWNKEVWTANPWADSSSKWTTEIKSLVGYVNANDGVFFVSPEDFINTFDLVNWAEVNPNYEVSFIDIPIDYTNLNTIKTYTTTLKIAGNLAKLPVYVYIDQPDGRLFENCGDPYQLYSMKATTSTGSTINPTQVSEYVVTLTTDGTYTFTANIANKASYSKYLTVTAYHPKGTFNFTSTFVKVAEKGCSALNNCNGNGKCNYLTGTCQCFVGVNKNKKYLLYFLIVRFLKLISLFII